MAQPASQHNADSIVSWLHEQGLKGLDGGKVLEGLCEHLCKSGVDVERAVVGYLVFHPQFDGMNYTWTRDIGEAEHQAVTVRDILKMPSPFLDMQSSEIREMRYHLEKHQGPYRYPFLAHIHERGFTDYFAFFEQFGTYADHNIWPDLPVGMRMYEGVTGSFGTKRKGGFTDADLEHLRMLAAPISIAVRIGAILEMAETLLGAYLGKESGRNVLRGHVRRGQGQIIHAVVWHSDLRDSTILAETVPLEIYLEILNRYYDCVVGAVMDHGGEVLKFVGDGVLAIFPFEPASRDANEAPQKALAAATDALKRLNVVNSERSAAGEEPIRCGIALHSGDLMYGNVGSAHRLDFTVMGATVNEVVRLETLCKKLGVPLVISETVAKVSQMHLELLGEYELPGIGRGIKVFTVDGNLSGSL
jgi:adenylate cyclase